ERRGADRVGRAGVEGEVRQTRARGRVAEGGRATQRRLADGQAGVLGVGERAGRGLARADRDLDRVVTGVVARAAGEARGIAVYPDLEVAGARRVAAGDTRHVPAGEGRLGDLLGAELAGRQIDRAVAAGSRWAARGRDA